MGDHHHRGWLLPRVLPWRRILPRVLPWLLGILPPRVLWVGRVLLFTHCKNLMLLSRSRAIGQQLR
jgi:hypothetical protein